MRKTMWKNAANIITLFRMGLLFVVIALLSIEHGMCRALGLLILLFAAFLDGADGYIARKFNLVSNPGQMLDILGDRVTENCMLIFFACKQLLPLGVVIIFVTRSFISDFLRSLNFNKGIGTFDINTSVLGRIFVSSNISRVLYLLAKIMLFVGASLVLVLETPEFAAGESVVFMLKNSVCYGSFLVLALSLIRFVILLYDSRSTVKEYFFYE